MHARSSGVASRGYSRKIGEVAEAHRFSLPFSKRDFMKSQRRTEFARSRTAETCVEGNGSNLIPLSSCFSQIQYTFTLDHDYERQRNMWPITVQPPRSDPRSDPKKLEEKS